MDLSDIKRAAEAAREFDHIVGSITFKLRLPTPFQSECAAAGQGFAGKRSAAEAVVRAQRALTELAVVGWSGAFVRDVLGAGHKYGDDEFAYEPDAVATLLDERRDIAEALWLPLLERMEARNKAQEATAKNWQRASPGTSPKPVRASSQPRA